VVLIKNRPIRIVLYWQLCLTIVMALAAGWWGGSASGVSAFLGGLISVVASAVYGLIVSRVGVTSAGRVLRSALRAQALKIVLMALLLGLVFIFYKGVVAVALFGAFAVTVLVFRVALFVRDEK